MCVKKIPLAQSTKTSSPAKGHLRSVASTRSLTSFPSQETPVKLETSSPEKMPGNSALLGLPGYRPVTRSSLRLQGTSSSSLGMCRQGRHLGCWLWVSALAWGVNSYLGPLSSFPALDLGRSTMNLGMCQDEPEQLDDWNRIAELQRRNQARPPHLKTSYPLESMVRQGTGRSGSPFSRTGVWEGVWEWTVPTGNIPTSSSQPSTSMGTITDEDMKMGDPEETLRHASMQPSQIIAASSKAGGQCSTRAPTQASSITTRQQRKRLSEETHQGPDTPPVSSAQPPITAPYRGQLQVFQVFRELLWPCG